MRRKFTFGKRMLEKIHSAPRVLGTVIQKTWLCKGLVFHLIKQGTQFSTSFNKNLSSLQFIIPLNPWSPRIPTPWPFCPWPERILSHSALLNEYQMFQSVWALSHKVFTVRVKVGLCYRPYRALSLRRRIKRRRTHWFWASKMLVLWCPQI